MAKQYIERIRLNKEIEPDSFLKNVPAIKYLIQEKELSFNCPVTFIIGENGTGKSTLLEGIAVAYGFNAEGGSRNFNFSTVNTHANLHEYLTIIKTAYPKDGYFLRAESFYNVASNIDELDKELPLLNSYGGRSLHAQSHGESFMALIENRFGGNGLYILDEPEAALSPQRLMTLLIDIHELVKRHSQFIIATHSPILLAYPNAEIYQITEDGIDLTTYQNTNHYQLTKQFLENYEQFIHQLLDES
ncbi:MAG: AAA family ATPase [Erysipelotrichaceae bacterium]|nr:AAA family ATPase [Erysipelotrichaceae bacterium]